MRGLRFGLLLNRRKEKGFVRSVGSLTGMAPDRTAHHNSPPSNGLTVGHVYHDVFGAVGTRNRGQGAHEQGGEKWHRRIPRQAGSVGVKGTAIR